MTYFSIIRLKASMTAIIDSFQNTAFFFAKKLFSDNSTTQSCIISTSETAKRVDARPGMRDGTISINTAPNVNSYLTTAATLFFFDEMHFFKDCHCDQQSLFKYELSVRDMGSEVKQLHNLSRLYIIVFLFEVPAFLHFIDTIGIF